MMGPLNVLTNRILRQLPLHDLEQVCRRAEPVTLPLGEVLCDPGRSLGYVYFPNGGILSSIVLLECGGVAEAAMIGNEGMAGFALLADAVSSPHRVIQQVRGEVLRIPVTDFRRALAESKALHELTERYVMALLQQCAQNAACFAHHGVRERMCRWLLAVTDGLASEKFDITQEYLAQTLGVRRQTVSLTAQLLQRNGLISYRRGQIIIHDQEALQQIACECYRVTRESYERIVRLPQLSRFRGQPA